MTTRRSLNDTDIAELRKLLESTDTQLVTADDKETYAKSVKRWSSAAEKPAGACLIPKSNEAVSIALKYASKNNIEVAVRGGGHSSAGASSTNGGLLIDLNGAMRHTEIDVQNKTVRVGGGAVWGDVDSALAPYGLATVGGTVSDTGVGGLALGGGYGWLSIKYGLVCDNILECTAVLADGRIVKASEKENVDLFWALRGAGHNFGVVTEFVFQAYEQGDMWAGFVMFPAGPEMITKIVDICNKIYGPGNDGTRIAEGKAAGGFGFMRPPPDEGKAMFKELLDLGPVMSTMGTVTYEKGNKLMDIPIGMRVSMKGAAFELPVRSEFVVSTFESFQKFTEDAAILKVSNSATAFANRGPHMNAVIAPFWTDEKNDDVCRQWARDVALIFTKELESRGAEAGESTDGFIGKRGEHGASMIYGNYDQHEEKSKDVFGGNYERLQGLKAKYDPGNVFSKLFAITPSS